MGGGIMNAVPREKFFLGKVAKAVTKPLKKAAKTVGKIAKSDIGKAALGAAALYYMPKYGIKDMGGLPAFLQGAKTGIGNFLLGTPGDTGGRVAGTNIFSKFGKALGIGGGGKGMSNLGKLATLGAVSTFLTKQFGMSPEQAEETLANPESRALYLRRYYQNLNPNAGDEEVEEFVAANVAEYMAEGGRIGYASGTGYNASKRYSILIDKYNKGIPLTPDELDELEMLEMTYSDKSETLDMAEGGRIGFAEGKSGIMKMASDILGDESDALAIQLFGKPVKELNPAEMEELQMEIDRLINKFRAEGPVLPPDRTMAAVGGKMDTASDNAMQAAGIEGLPIRQNPKGIKELDLRDTGGFIPPVGIKEKEDDIPAMLSNNEFVFTADAVRGMGGGDVNKGAQMLYDQMKMLEAGGKV